MGEMRRFKERGRWEDTVKERIKWRNGFASI